MEFLSTALIVEAWKRSPDLLQAPSAFSASAIRLIDMPPLRLFWAQVRAAHVRTAAATWQAAAAAAHPAPHLLSVAALRTAVANCLSSVPVLFAIPALASVGNFTAAERPQ
jgi:hypothetical protein